MNWCSPVLFSVPLYFPVFFYSLLSLTVSNSDCSCDWLPTTNRKMSVLSLWETAICMQMNLAISVKIRTQVANLSFQVITESTDLNV